MTRDCRKMPAMGSFPKLIFALLLTWAAGSLSQRWEDAQLFLDCLDPIAFSINPLWKGHLEILPKRIIPPELQHGMGRFQSDEFSYSTPLPFLFVCMLLTPTNHHVKIKIAWMLPTTRDPPLRKKLLQAASSIASLGYWSPTALNP